METVARAEPGSKFGSDHRLADHLPVGQQVERLAPAVQGKLGMHMGEITPSSAIRHTACAFSRPFSGNRRPYSPARTPITEKPLISGRLTETVGMRPEVKPITSRRPSKAMQRTLSSNTSPPTGS